MYIIIKKTAICYIYGDCSDAFDNKNFVAIPCQKKFSVQKYEFDRSICMADMCYSCPTSAAPTYEQLLGEENTCPNFISLSKKRWPSSHIDAIG